MTWDRKHKQ